MQDDRDHQNNAPERFLDSLDDLFDASIDYSIDTRARVEAFHEARRRVETAWAALQAHSAADADDLRTPVSGVRARIGDTLFYDKNATDPAIAEYEAALALDPDCIEALKGIIAACLQGSPCRPTQALPYALRLVEFQPTAARDVEYIRTLIAAQTAPTE